MRRLAAIGAAYVSNYLRPVEADRQGTPARLRHLRRDLIPKLAPHEGRALKPAGDLEPTPIMAG